jgi:hypothetical protein
MSRKTIIISSIIIITVLVIIGIALFYPFNQSPISNSVEQFQQTEKNIKEQNTPENQEPEVVFPGGATEKVDVGPTPVERIDFKNSEIKAYLISKTSFPLLNNYFLYSISETEVNSNPNLQKEFITRNIQCDNECLVIEKDSQLIFPEPSIFYISSFEKNSNIYWVVFDRQTDGFVKVIVYLEGFKEGKEIIELGGFSTKVLEKGQNLGIFELEIRKGNGINPGFEKISVDFKEKI